jgi:putative transposase
MARPLRIEFPGATYHVTSRGDRREPIFADDSDRSALLAVVATALERFDAQMLAYCLMGNHYHFVLFTRHGNLSRLMRHINGVYTQTFNRRHAKVGHLFQGRFKAILVDRDAYLLEVCRYVELNPVRAKMVKHAADWPWSSFAAHTALPSGPPAPKWLDVAGLHGYVLGYTSQSAADHARAARRYGRHVEAAPDIQLWADGLRQQIYLGDDDFVRRMQHLQKRTEQLDKRRSSPDVPSEQTRPPLSVEQWLMDAVTREQGIYDAHTKGRHTLTAIAAVLGLSVSRVSRLLAAYEDPKDTG